MFTDLKRSIDAKEKVTSYAYRNMWQTLIFPDLLEEDIVFLCIGSNRCTGDAYGPLVGTYLKERGFTNIYGTIDQPVHHLNLQEILAQIPPSQKIIAIDAALGRKDHVGYLFLERGPIEPGKGVGKVNPPVGDYHIKGVVNIQTGFQQQLLLMCTQLNIVMNMAKQTAFVLRWLFPRQGALM